MNTINKMQHFMKSILTLLLLCCLGLAGAQNTTLPVKVSGRVIFGNQDQAARNVSINFYTESGRTSVLTNLEGFYSTSVNVIPYVPYAKLAVEVVDFCTGQTQSKVLLVTADSTTFTNVNFRICDNTNPPPPRNECKAFFTYKTDPAAPKTVYFQDLSTRPTFIFQWKWNFGDSTTSNEQNPVHTYATAGIYSVSLTISSETTDSVCTASFTTTVSVRDTADCNCTREYVPVCVTTANGSVITFPNKCQALCAGYSEFQIGTCRDTSCICPAIYAPVCVKLADGTIKTYGNSCEAACYGFTERDFVECRRDTCDCPTDEYVPVCVVVNGDTLTYGNACRAKCAGFKESDFVKCNINNDCNCDLQYAPVCVISENGDTLTFSNKCFAYCKGYEAQDFVLCESNPGCICPAVYDPVCVKLRDGTIKTYGNSCEAQCAGFTERDFVACDTTGCNCPKILEPVCAIGANGDTLTFTNKCFAVCEGYNSEQLFECRPNDCFCPLNYDPICALGANGDTITFSNKCFAVCEGYTNLFRCNTNDPNDKCSAAFAVIYPPNNALNIDFKDFSKVLEGTILGWKWDFGDGTSGDSQNPTHTYARPGVYLVTQYIATSTGCTSSSTQAVYAGGGEVVPPPSCQAMLTFVQKPNNPNTIEFKNLSFGNISSILWEFGDGYTSTEKNPTHTYSSNGVFFVRLTIRSTDCESTASMVLFIDPNAIYENECNALFLPALFIDSLQVAFRNMSSTDAKDFKWSFGDGTTSTDFAPLHVYREKGIYEVTLTITTANGCTSTFRSTINLGTQNFTGNPEYRVASTTSTDETQILRNVKLYPNPVQDELTLEFNAPTAGSYLLQIFSLEGKLLQSTRESASSGSNINQLNTSNLSAGMYLLRIQTDRQTKSIKFIKS